MNVPLHKPGHEQLAVQIDDAGAQAHHRHRARLITNMSDGIALHGNRFGPFLMPGHCVDAAVSEDEIRLGIVGVGTT